MYDGFISYSHAADDLLAPRLQAGLQRFAKPWWKRRAIRIFRDESSLAANPHLWSSIVEALEGSDWFVLLLSENAASSEWVGKEIEHWVEHGDPSRILPVVTDGTFTWDGDVQGSAVPPALHGVFTEEPRWVDLRFARGEEQLDLQNPEFSNAVADVASAIRGIPKDELASEEVRQHRRTVRTAWAAGAALLVLAIAAIGFGIQAASERDKAQRLAESEAVARADAETQRQAAVDSAAEADRQRETAEDSADEAARQAQLAKSRELAATAVSVLSDDPELSTMLALESIKTTPEGSATSAAGVIALRQASRDNRVLARSTVAKSFNTGAISADGGTYYYTSNADSLLTAKDVDTGSVLWTYQHPDPITLREISPSPDGSLIAVGTNPASNESASDPGSVLILDSANGEILEVLNPGPCAVAQLFEGFTADGRWLAVNSGTEECFVTEAAMWISVYDTENWSEAYRIPIPGFWGGSSFSSDSSLVLVWGSGSEEAQLLRFPDLTPVSTFATAAWAALSPDGSRVVVTPVPTDFRLKLLDAETGQLISHLDVDTFLSFNSVSFSPDGTRIAVTTREDEFVFDALTGQELVRFRASGHEFSHDFSYDGRRLVTSADTGVAVWDLVSDAQSGGIPIATDNLAAMWVNPNAVVVGDQPALWAFVEDWALATFLLTPGSTEVEATFEGLASAQTPDGRFMGWMARSSSDGTDLVMGPTVLWDPVSDEVEILDDCTSRNSEPAPMGCFVARNSFVSPDGTILASDSQLLADNTQIIKTWDAATLDVKTEFTVGKEEFLEAAGNTWLAVFEGLPATLRIVSHDGSFITRLPSEGVKVELTTPHPHESMVLVGSIDGRLAYFDTETWDEIAGWAAHGALLRGLALSEDANRLATSGEDGFVNVWDVSDIRDLESGVPPLLDRIPALDVSDMIWIDDETLLLIHRQGVTSTVSLNVEALVTSARDRLTRAFTPEECGAYRIEDCPTTLEAIRGN